MPLLGVCPIGKFVFSHEDALAQKTAIFEKLNEMKINYCTIENVISNGMVRDQKHVEPVVEHFKKQRIDALFVPHCNFGTEGAVGMIAKKLSVPVLIWGPRDEAPLPDGSRLRDTLCGMFATTGVLYKLQVPFTYIENCRINENQFEQGISLFIRASAVAKAIRKMKIGQIGNRIDFFWSTIIDERDLLQKFGIQVFPIDMVEFLWNIKKRASQNKTIYSKEVDDIKKWLSVEGLNDNEPLINSLALRDELIELAQDQNLDAFAIQSFSSIQKELGGASGLGGSMVEDAGIPIASETDIHGAISSVLLEASSNTLEPSFFPEFTIRHPENDNAVLMWHAEAPLSLRDGKSKVKLAPPWILKNLPPDSLHFKLKDGMLTVCRFEKAGNEYVLGVGEGKTVPGPYTQEFYVWMEVDDWPHWERKLMDGPYIHHCSAIYDQCADVLVEACKYIPHLKPDRFEKNLA